ncbi:MAG: carboxypeptidase regulatory-like domain-containing protein, partial [Gemmatimonadota bacterium]
MKRVGREMPMMGMLKMRPLAVVFTLLSLTATHIEAQLDARYHTYEEMVAELDSMADVHSDIMRVDSIGVSTQDSMIVWAVKISDNVDVEEDEPAVLYNGVHHAEEALGLEICLDMIGELVDRYGANSQVTWWINNIEIWFVPLLNPEGHKVVTDGLDVTFRKTKRDNNGNGVFDFIPEIGGDIDGVDPNRNYDFNWERGDTSWASDNYRGPAPFSESENRALRDLALEQKFVFALLYHSARTGTKEVIYYPWCWEEKRPPDFPVIQYTAEEVAQLITTDDGRFSYSPWCSSLRAPFARDWFYVKVGTIPILIEVGSTIQPPGEMVDGICARNMVGAYYLLDRVMAGGITGRVTDGISGEPLEAEVRVLEASGGIVSPRLCDRMYGRYRRILVPGVYTLEVTHPGYRGKRFSDVVVNPSSPTVVDVELTPLPRWNCAGSLTDFQTGEPVGASLFFEGPTVDTVCSNFSTGDFDVTLSEGTYRVIITADNYVAHVESFYLSDDTTFSLELCQAETLFHDHFEGRIYQWNPGGEGSSWGTSGSRYHSVSLSLTDSPSGYYTNGGDTWAAMVRGIDLTSYGSAAVDFWHYAYFEPDNDSAFVEISTDGGFEWEVLSRDFHGYRREWIHEFFSLREYCGLADDVRIRFRLLTDGSVNDDGWFVDDVRICGGGVSGCRGGDRGDVNGD